MLSVPQPAEITSFSFARSPFYDVPASAASDASVDGERAIFRDSAPCAPSQQKAPGNDHGYSRSFEGVDPKNYTKGTIIIHANIKNSRIMLVDDPTLEDSQAIVGRCGVELHYTRDTVTEIATMVRDFKESIHMSIKNLELYSLKNVLKYYPKAILQPLAIEFNMRREAYVNMIEF